MKKNNTQTQPLAANTKKWLIITAILVVAVIALTIVLVEFLKPAQKTPDDNPNPDNPSSSLTIRNGDFRYPVSANSNYPQAAQNWTRYGYKAPSGTSHDFEEINSTQNVVMGIIDTDGEKWNKVTEDLAAEGITITNPGVHSDELLDKNVYMIAAKNPTAASILSDSFSIPSQSSAKITVRLNTAQLKDGSKAVIMLQKNNTNAKEENWYAYDFEIAKNTDGWQSYEFYIFNRDSGSKSVKCSVGLGNVYGVNETNEENETTNTPVNAEGVLFIDDIMFETVTANDYRIYADKDGVDHTAYIIENDDTESKAEYVELNNAADGSALGSIEKSEDYLALLGDGNHYSPFTDKYDFDNGMKIYNVSNDGTKTSPVGVQLKNTIKVQIDPVEKDYHHISFWVRVAEENKLATANIALQKLVGGKFETIDAGSFTLQETSQEISTDVNCGWKKYDIYLRPSSVETELTVKITLGKADGYTADELKPQGTLFVTSPSYEIISSKDYNNASSGTYAKKVSLIGATSSSGVTNGSFSNTTTTLNDQPTGWTPVFAGDNALYKDGKGDVTVGDMNKTDAAVKGSGVVKDAHIAPSADDTEKGVLKLVNNVATSHGYISSNISLSAKSVYVLSVLAKTEGTAKPYFYVLNDSKDRDNAVVARVESVPANSIDDSVFGYTDSSLEGSGWQRYYAVIVTGEESQTVRIALFNGDIDGAHPQQGVVYYDKADMKQIGSYSLEKPEDVEEPTEYEVKWASQSDDAYVTFDKLELKDKDGKAFDNVVTNEPTEDEWKEMKTIPAEDDKDDDNNETPVERDPIDLGLLFSVISSVALLAALGVVIVVFIYRKKRN